MNSCRKIANVNLLNLNNSIHILHTVIHTDLVLLIRRICLTISIFSRAAGSFFYRKRMTENRPAKTLAYDISQKINGGLLRLESFIFFCN